MVGLEPANDQQEIIERVGVAGVLRQSSWHHTAPAGAGGDDVLDDDPVVAGDGLTGCSSSASPGW